MARSLAICGFTLLVLCAATTTWAQSDDCATATPIGTGDLDFPYDNSTFTTSPEPVPGSCPSNGQIAIGYTHDLWVSYVASKAITSIFLDGSIGDPIFAVYDSCANAAAGTAIDCEDRGFDGGFVISTVVGATYLIRIGADNNATPVPGPGVLEIRALDPASNDECLTAIPLTTGSHTVTIIGASTGTDPNPAPCPSQASTNDSYQNDVWFSWVADAPEAFFTWQGVSPLANPIIAVYDSCASALAGDAIDCDDRGNPTFIGFPVIVGNTYLIRLANDSSGVGIGQFNIFAGAAPPNDECAGAIAVTSFVPVGVELFPATTGVDPGPGPCPNQPSATDNYTDDLWYTWVADNVFAYFQWQGQTPLTNPVHAIYSSCANAAAGIAVDCEDRGNPNFINLSVTIGSTYWVRIASDSTTGATGIGTLLVESYPPAVNDECATPISLGTGDVSTLTPTFGGTTSVEPVPHLCAAGGQVSFLYQQDVWFSWTATSGAALFELTNTGDPVFALYDGCANAALGIAIDCEDRGTNGSFEAATVPGQTYVIRVGHGFSIGGVAELTITALQGGVRNLACTVLGDAYTLDWDQPINGQVGDTITIESSEPGVVNPIATLTNSGAATGTFSGTLLPANQGMPTNVVYSLVYSGSLGASTAVDCPAAFHPLVGEECSSAAALGAGDIVVNYNNSSASDSPEPDPLACLSNGQAAINYRNDLWFAWTATKPTTFIEVEANAGAPVFAVYASCSAAAVGNAIDCEDRGLAGGFAFPTQPGNSYLVRVASDSGIGAGPGVLRLTGFDLAVNDECSGAIALGAAPHDVSFSTLAATASPEPNPTGPCPSGFFFLPGGFPGDLWYSWVSSGDLTFIRVRGTSGITDPAVAIYASCADAAIGQALDCISLINPSTILTGPLVAGQTYLLRISHENSSVGVGDFVIEEFPISGSNDECATATHLGTGNQVATFETVSATASPEMLPLGPCPSTTVLPTAFPADIWYSWESSGGLASISVEGFAGITDPVIALYEGCSLAAAGIALDCEDRGDPSTILFGPLAPGVTYFIRLSHEVSAAGVGALTIEEFLPAPNDECLAATDLGTGNVSLEVELRAATGSNDPPPAAGSCAGDVFTANNYDPDVWYRWTAHTDAVRISYAQKQPSPVSDPVFAVYRSCLDAAAGVFLDCQDNGPTINELLLTLTIGDTYIVRCADDGGALGGRGTLTIASVQDNVMNLSCTNTVPTPNYDVSWTNPANGAIGDMIEISSDEPGLANPILHILPWPTTAIPVGTLLAANQSTTSLAVTFSVRYLSATLGASIDDELCTIVFNPQPGETCEFRTSIGSGDLIQNYDTTAFVGSGAPVPGGCASGGQFATRYGTDRWFSWTATGELTEFAVASTGGAPLLAVYDSCADAAAGLAIDCAAGGAMISLRTPTTIGQTYILRVGDDEIAGVVTPGSASLTIVTQPPPVTNLACAPTAGDATTLTWDNPVSGTTGDLILIDSNEPGVVNPVAMLTAPANSVAYVLLPANQGQGTAVQFDVRYVSTLGVSDNRSCSAVFNPIANDECAAAISLAGPLPITVSANLEAATESPEPDVTSVSCGSATNFDQDGWYEWTATTPEVEISWRSTDMTDPNVALYASCADAAAGIAIACADGGIGEATINTPVVVGNTYTIRVGDDDSPSLGIGELTIDPQCFDLELFSADYDCVNQIVTLSWTETDAYVSLQLTANGVRTTQQPTPLAIGAPNGLIIFSPPLNMSVTYELTATCANGGTSTAAATVTTTTPNGSEQLIISLEQPSLVDSTTALATALGNAGLTPAVVTSQDNPCLDTFLADATTIWVVEGTFPDSGSVAPPLGDALFAAIESGKPVYLEGGDHWTFGTTTLYDQVDGVDRAAVDDGDDSLTQLDAFDAPALSALAATAFPLPISYTQDQTGNDRTDQLVVADSIIDPGISDAAAIFRNAPDAGESDYVVGTVALTTSGPVTISSSFEFGGFGDSSARDQLAAFYLSQFGAATLFQRGDCNNDGAKNIADAVRLLNFLFPPTPPAVPLDCDASCDGNDDGFLNIADAVAILSVLFPSGPPVAWLPPDTCGADPTPDTLTCALYTGCP